MTALSGWENFYVIVGSSAGALIGLQFVVMTLIAGMPITRRDAQAGDAFSTPTVVHFAVVLLLSAVGWVACSIAGCGTSENRYELDEEARKSVRASKVGDPSKFAKPGKGRVGRR